MSQMNRVFIFLMAVLLVTGGTMMIQGADAGDGKNSQTEQKQEDSTSGGHKIYA